MHIAIQDKLKGSSVIPDLLKPNLPLVICSRAINWNSTKIGHWYEHPSNRFWKTLHEIGLTPNELRPSDDHKLLQLGIGLTVLVKDQASIEQDCTHLPEKEVLADRLRDILRCYTPSRLAFNGKCRGAVSLALGMDVCWGLNEKVLDDFPNTPIWVLPDTSGANNRHFPRLFQHWRDLSKDVRRTT
ncbi:MAG: mismatch-specific DNA-glycosylase [Aestuariivita sp.]|nr:mismatch-specific DNA-glycosylase [Aestuariivita sp.]MCY4348119.1 mismatch-specific DNA-glycosylase [Aestuariivita sp.]